MVVTWLAADCGGQFCMAGRCRTLSGTTALARWATCRLLLGLWCRGVASSCFCMESSLSCATVLMSQSNRLLFEWSLRGVVWSCWPVMVSLLFVVVPSLGVVPFLI